MRECTCTEWYFRAMTTIMVTAVPAAEGTIGEDRVKTLVRASIASVALAGLLVTPALAARPSDLDNNGKAVAFVADTGFDQFGYNEVANIFSGKADGVDRNLDGMVWGDATYANDLLVMKWNETWDECNANGYDTAAYCAGAWTTNEWNGAVTGGSGEVWHYKIIWVGSEGLNSAYWVPGGYPVWGNYEVVMDQGITKGAGHTWFAHGIPNGLGG